MKNEQKKITGTLAREFEQPVNAYKIPKKKTGLA